jgi:hypothetical protein
LARLRWRLRRDGLLIVDYCATLQKLKPRRTWQTQKQGQGAGSGELGADALDVRGWRMISDDRSQISAVRQQRSEGATESNAQRSLRTVGSSEPEATSNAQHSISEAALSVQSRIQEFRSPRIGTLPSRKRTFRQLDQRSTMDLID